MSYTYAFDIKWTVLSYPTGIADATYTECFAKFEGIYADGAEPPLLELTSHVVSAAASHTVDIWHTVVTTTGMGQRGRSRQPLLW